MTSIEENNHLIPNKLPPEELAADELLVLDSYQRSDGNLAESLGAVSLNGSDNHSAPNPGLIQPLEGHEPQPVRSEAERLREALKPAIIEYLGQQDLVHIEKAKVSKGSYRRHDSVLPRVLDLHWLLSDEEGQTEPLSIRDAAEYLQYQLIAVTDFSVKVLIKETLKDIRDNSKDSEARRNAKDYLDCLDSQE